MGHMCTYMVHVPLHVSGLILHGAFQTKFLGILYHKLSTFMVIRRSAWCFKCDFRIFEILGNYFIMTMMALWWRHSPRFLCYQWDFLLDIFTEEGSYQWIKDATSFGLISDKSTEIRGSEYWKSCQFSIHTKLAIFGFLVRMLRMQINWWWCHVHA